MKKIILFSLLLVMVLTLSGCGQKQNQPSSTPTPETQPVANNNTNNDQGVLQGQVDVSMINFTFSPASITIKKGTIVTWKNNDSASHQVAADEAPTTVYTNSLVSQVMAPNQTFSFTFDELGTYNYHCKIHPQMKGSIIVVE